MNLTKRSLSLSFCALVFGFCAHQPILAAESTQDLYRLGFRQFKSHDYNTAIKTFNQVLGMDRFYWQAYWGRGFASAKLGQFANALNEFARYQGFRDDLGKYGDMKPFDLNYQDNCEAAAKIFTDYLKNHKKWFLYAGRATSYLKLKKVDAARADLDEAIKTLPQDETVLVATAFAMRGNCNLVLGNAEAAVTDYTSALNARQLCPIFRARALAYKKLGKTDLAARDLTSSKTDKAGESLKALFTGNKPSAED